MSRVTYVNHRRIDVVTTGGETLHINPVTKMCRSFWFGSERKFVLHERSIEVESLNNSTPYSFSMYRQSIKKLRRLMGE